LAAAPTPWLWAPAAYFILAAASAWPAFNTEGLVDGRYRGLPVTYNGYLFPAVARRSTS